MDLLSLSYRSNSFRVIILQYFKVSITYPLFTILSHYGADSCTIIQLHIHIFKFTSLQFNSTFCNCLHIRNCNIAPKLVNTLSIYYVVVNLPCCSQYVVNLLYCNQYIFNLLYVYKRKYAHQCIICVDDITFVHVSGDA